MRAIAILPPGRPLPIYDVKNEGKIVSIRNGGNQMNGYYVLANAVIIQAVKDYKSAIHMLKKNPESKMAMRKALVLEEFFHSGWYKILTDVDAEYLLDRLRKEAVA